MSDDWLDLIRRALGTLVVVACAVSAVLITGIKLFLGPPSDDELDEPTMSDDIVARLRAVLHDDRSVELMAREAADEIERLRTRIAQLEAK